MKDELTLDRLRKLAEPTVGAWCRLYQIEDAATANDLREAIASYGQMLLQHHLGSDLSSGGAGTAPSESIRATTSRAVSPSGCPFSRMS